MSTCDRGKSNGVIEILQEIYHFTKPGGPLSDRVPLAVIASANNEVKDLVTQEGDVLDSTCTYTIAAKKRGQYPSYTEESMKNVSSAMIFHLL